MKLWAVLLLSTMLAACATAPVSPLDPRLFNDQLFLAQSQRIDAADVFAVSPAMKHYLSADIASQLRAKGHNRALVDALYSTGQLKLEYDSTMTRNASQAFDARSGNCLSLVIMTAAFARELGLSVRYQNVHTDETWSRSGDIYLSIGHVNLTLGNKYADLGFGFNETTPLTIDFLPPSNLRGLRTRDIGQETIVAMYMNNRAVESLTQGQLNDAYWWAREAIAQDPGFLISYNTLGAVYQRHGNPKEAEQVYTHVLEREPKNTHVMSNLAAILSDTGRVAEAGVLTRQLEQLEPHPPFSYFNQGMAAIRIGDFKAARDLFAKEVDRADYYHEFHFWLAVAYAGLGDAEQTRKHLTIAMESSTTRKDHDLYAAKLDRMRSYPPQ
jgi:Tfp pilus assembly protein PilF